MSRPSLSLEVPAPAADHPRWARASVLAMMGFGLGVFLPKILDVKLGPNPPTDARPAVRVATASARPGTPPVTSGIPSLEVPGAVPNVPSHEARVEIGEGQITACKDANGKAAKTCEPSPALDGALAVPLRGLTKCPSAMGLSGKLSIGFDVDFKKKTLKPQRGKSTTLPSSTVEGMLKCLEKPLSTLSLDGVSQDQTKLTVFYQIAFFPPGKPAEATPEPPPAGADGKPAEAAELEVTWKSCTLRDAPRTGTPVGKLTKGTKLKVIDKKGDWLKVIASPSKQEGWLIKTATEKLAYHLRSRAHAGLKCTEGLANHASPSRFHHRADGAGLSVCGLRRTRR